MFLDRNFQDPLVRDRADRQTLSPQIENQYNHLQINHLFRVCFGLLCQADIPADSVPEGMSPGQSSALELGIVHLSLTWRTEFVLSLAGGTPRNSDRLRFCSAA